MPDILDTRLAAFASSLREAGAIRSDVVERAFATVARHRCVPRFRYGPDTITVPQDALPGGAVLDLVYSHQSLVTSTGRDGQPPSSSSAPTLMARMLEALDVRPGLSVLEIGAGTGYNAALITTITGIPVITVEAGADTARGAAESLRRLGLDHRVTVRHSAPIAHGGVHPVLVTTAAPGTVRGTAALWADFMAAAGPLRPAELTGHDPAEDIPATAVTRIPDASPTRTTAAYHDLWFFLATPPSPAPTPTRAPSTPPRAPARCTFPRAGRRGSRPTEASRSRGSPQ